jgi:gliding motility-associated protein GldM
MSIPKEPRQLMINLMYLVLTALLALNVSSEILNAFKIIRSSIVKSNENIGTRNTGMLAKFEAAAVDPEIEDAAKRARFAACSEIAKKLATYSDSVVTVIEGYKTEIVKGSDGYKDGTTELKAPENLDAATRLMIEQPQPKGKEFFDMLQKYKRDLASMVPIVVDKVIVQNGEFDPKLDSTLPITFKPGQTATDWSFENFHMTPTIGALTLADKYINDIRNAQTAINDELWWAASQEKRPKKTDIMIPDPKDEALVFDKYALMVSSPNTYLLEGEKYTATAMIGAYASKNNKASITINGNSYPMVNGQVKFETTATKAGENPITLGGSYYDPNYKTTRTLDQIKTSFFVGKPAASIELDKMNVFYIGLDNPITIAASGVPLSSVSLVPSGVTLIEQSPGHYFVKPISEKAGPATIAMSAKRADGSIQNFGTKTYRCKRVPDPIIQFAGKESGASIQSHIAKVQMGPFPLLKDFLYDFRFRTVSFVLAHQPKKGPYAEATVNGETFTGDAAAIIKSLKQGDRIYFDNIKVQGQGLKEIRTLPGTSYKIN